MHYNRLKTNNFGKVPWEVLWPVHFHVAEAHAFPRDSPVSQSLTSPVQLVLEISELCRAGGVGGEGDVSPHISVSASTTVDFHIQCFKF